jgi:hypothetical protein
MRRRAWLVGMMLLVALPAQAIPFAEDATLFAIWKQNIEQAIKADATLNFMREFSREISDVGKFARDAVKAGNNVRLILEDPERFARLAAASWASNFPEVHEIIGNVIDARLALQELSDPEFYRTYDPYAYVRAFDSLQNVNHGAYEVAARAVDLWGIHDAHDATLKMLREQHQASVEAFKEVGGAINQLSPLEAQVHTARTSNLTALASIQAATVLERMAIQTEMRFMGDGATSENDRVRRTQMQADFARIRMDWNLDPTGRSR